MARLARLEWAGCGQAFPGQAWQANLINNFEAINMFNFQKVKTWGPLAVLAFFCLIVFFKTVYVVDEGHVGIVKRLGKATHQELPGVHVKVPFVDSVVTIEVRTRKNEETMPSATAEQMPVTVHASLNWTVSKESAIDLYKLYGGLDQFESRIVDPRFRTAVKAAVPKFKAEKLIQDRTLTIAQIEDILRGEMAPYPVSIDNIQVENIELPPQYINSIQIKQTEKNLADAEQHKLDRQKLEAMQAVNTADASAQSVVLAAEADANAIKMKADAEAHAIRVRGESEALAIKAKSAALKDNPMIIEFTKAERWNGAQPQTVLGTGQGVFLNLK